MQKGLPAIAGSLLSAESLVYGRDCEPMGPLPVMAIHKDDGIEISFIHTGEGLVCTGDVPFDILEPGVSIYRVKACRYDCHGGNGTGRASGVVRELSPVQCQFVGQ